MYVTSDGCFLKDTLSDLTHTNAYTYGRCQAPHWNLIPGPTIGKLAREGPWYWSSFGQVCTWSSVLLLVHPTKQSVLHSNKLLSALLGLNLLSFLICSQAKWINQSQGNN